MSISIGTRAALRGLCVVLTLVCLARAERAAAQDSAESYDAIIAEAVSEYDEGMWQEARILFKRAHALKPSARTWYGIGISAFQAQHYVEASEALESALSDTRKPLTPSDEEISANPRSSSSKVRAARRLPDPEGKVSTW